MTISSSLQKHDEQLFLPFWGSDTFFVQRREVVELYTLSEYRHENGHFGRTLFGRKMKSAERRMELKRRGGNHWPFHYPWLDYFQGICLENEEETVVAK